MVLRTKMILRLYSQPPLGCLHLMLTIAFVLSVGFPFLLFYVFDICAFEICENDLKSSVNRHVVERMMCLVVMMLAGTS